MTIKANNGFGTTSTGGNIIIRTGIGSNSLYFGVSNETHDIDFYSSTHVRCKICKHEFLIGYSNMGLFTLDESIKDLTCNEVVMKDVIE